MAMINDIDFIRYLIDLIDTMKQTQQPPAAPTVVINIDNAGKVSTQDDEEEVETAMDRDDVFIPPLQAKIEMMKKMTGVEPKNQDLNQEIIATEEDEPFGD